MQLTINRAIQELKKPPQQNSAVKYLAGSGRTIVAHQDFLEWLDAKDTDVAQRKKARLVLKRLLSSGIAKNKSVVGVGKGWLRATLTGTAGSQFYLWYTTHGQLVGKSLGLKEGEIAVRKVRHHDETGIEIDTGDLGADYLRLKPQEIEGEIDGANQDVMYTRQQVDVAVKQTEAVQLLLGHPGSGKTTSLWFAASHSPSKKTLYLTYSQKLAQEAIANFRAFDNGSEIDVMTFGELVHYLADDRDDEPNGLTPLQAAQKLSELPKNRNLLSEWDGHFDELYADLHAYGVGQALPINFQDNVATTASCLTAKAYADIRSKDLGSKMAIAASKVLEYLSQELRIEELFPGPTRSRTLITDIHEPPPSRLVGVGTVLVDEVQDLTQIEALLLLNVVARIGCDSGTMPRLFMAGDESQTVRPTDFKWAWLKNLLTTVFGADLEIRDSHLAENLRSPKLIGQFIEATQVQYQNFNKGDRPSGISYTKNNDAEIGRLIYCQLHDKKEWQSLVQMFSQIPRSCLIYPGFTVPDDLIAASEGLVNIETAEEVKGRDFDVVGLIDAGKSQEVLSNLYKDRETNKYVDVFGRTLADQYRVAASRSAEKLILIDREADYFAQVSQMGKSRVSLEIERVDFDDLAKQLDGNFSIEELVRSQIETIRDVINDQPDRALLYLRTLAKQFETHKRESVVDRDLEFEVARISACVIAVSLLSKLKPDQVSREQLIKEADQIVNQLSNSELFEVIFDLAKNTASWSSDQTIGLMLKGAEIFSRVEIELPEVNSAYRKKLTYWFDDLAKNDALVDEKQTFRVLSDTAKFVESLSKPYPYMAEQIEQVRLNWAKQYSDKKKFETAIKILEQLQNRDHILEAKCYLESGKPALASKSYELGGDIEQAILCARKVPDIERALKLAKDTDSPSLKTLEWLNDAKMLFDNKSVRGAGQLTKQEGSALANWAAKSVTQNANESGDNEPL